MIIETADLKSARNVTHDCKQYKLVAIKPIICIYIRIEIVVLLYFPNTFFGSYCKLLWCIVLLRALVVGIWATDV